MRNALAVFTAGMVCITSFSALAKGAIDDPFLALAKREAPDVARWDKVAEGYFEGVGSRNEHVKIYTGLAGAKLDLAQEKATLRSFEERLGDGSLDQAKSVALDSGMVATLARIEHLERVIASHASTTEAKVVQTRNTYGSVCFYTTTGLTEFEANTLVMVDYPRAKATLNDFGNGTFGPLPPTFPVSVFREVGAGVGTNSPTETIDYTNTAAPLGAIVAEISTITFPGSCFLRTLQGVSARCTSGGAIEYYSLQRDQTCSGVLAGTPPTET